MPAIHWTQPILQRTVDDGIVTGESCLLRQSCQQVLSVVLTHHVDLTSYVDVPVTGAVATYAQPILNTTDAKGNQIGELDYFRGAVMGALGETQAMFVFLGHFQEACYLLSKEVAILQRGWSCLRCRWNG